MEHSPQLKEVIDEEYVGNKVFYISKFGTLATAKCIKQDEEVLYLENGRIITLFDLEITNNCIRSGGITNL